MVMLCATFIFKNDIVDYMKQSSKQRHEERLNELKLESQKLVIQAENQKLIELERQRLQQEKEKQQKKVDSKPKEVEAVQEKRQTSTESLWKTAKSKMCGEYQYKYAEQLKCVVNPYHDNCAKGYDSKAWFNSASYVRTDAINNGCNVHVDTWN